jgi:hypothetical protein
MTIYDSASGYAERDEVRTCLDCGERLMDDAGPYCPDCVYEEDQDE